MPTGSKQPHDFSCQNHGSSVSILQPIALGRRNAVISDCCSRPDPQHSLVRSTLMIKQRFPAHLINLPRDV
jgi:hypothetical protein